MKLVGVKPRYIEQGFAKDSSAALKSKTALTYFCTRCGERMRDDRDPVTADLDGPAFTAYYCPACTEIVAQSEPRIVGECVGCGKKIELAAPARGV